MGSEQSPVEASVDRVLEDATGTLARSAERLRSLDQLLHAQREARGAADVALERTRRLLEGVDIDLTDREPSPSTSAAPGSAPAVRVLVVDDNPSIREVVKLLLTLEFDDGVVEVRAVADGPAAIDAAGWQPQVLIVDWVMPGMDGLETSRRLRAALPGARILLYSAHLAVDAEERALGAGADRFLAKGTDPAGLVAEVAAVVAAAGSDAVSGLGGASPRPR